MRKPQSPLAIIFTVLLIIWSGLAAGTEAPVPPLLSYSGTLTDPLGKPVADGTYEVRFALYTVPSEGNPIWSETWNGATSPVHTTDGAFSVLLGSHTAIPEGLFANQPVTYLGVTVGTDVEMLPRHNASRASPMPYARATGCRRGPSSCGAGPWMRCRRGGRCAMGCSGRWPMGRS